MSTSQTLYGQYRDLTQKAADLNNAAASGFAFRGRQLATLATQAHEIVTSDAYGNLLQDLAAKADLTEDEAHNVRLSFEDYDKNKKLPPEFVDELTNASSICLNAWMTARKENDFSRYAPELDKMIALKRQQADFYGYEEHPYNALMDDYEKGATVGMLDAVFNQVKDKFPSLLKQISSSQQVEDGFFNHFYPQQQQWNLSLLLLRSIGYNFECGRQDMSEHPFTTSFSPKDVRITTRVNENDLASLLWSSIHEGGHALYEQGLPEAQYGLPLGAATSLSIHESQSRLWENCIGRSLPMWKHFYPIYQKVFAEQLSGVTTEGFYKAMNKVQPSLVRTEADELTYHFHVLIRYEIEKLLIGNKLTTADLPAFWNQQYEQYLGITPPDDLQGVLQDVHWSHGSFGYFPTYSLGSFYAAQFYEQALKEISGLEAQLEVGDFKQLLAWLRTNIHQYGRRYRSEELCQKITGRGLDPDAFIRYAQQKYAGIYGFSS